MGLWIAARKRSNSCIQCTFPERRGRGEKKLEQKKTRKVNKTNLRNSCFVHRRKREFQAPILAEGQIKFFQRAFGNGVFCFQF